MVARTKPGDCEETHISPADQDMIRYALPTYDVQFTADGLIARRIRSGVTRSVNVCSNDTVQKIIDAVSMRSFGLK